MKKIISLLLTGTLLITLNTACSNVSENKRSKTIQNSPAKSVTAIPLPVTLTNNTSIASPPSVSDSTISCFVSEEAAAATSFTEEPIINRQIFNMENPEVVSSLNTYQSILKNNLEFFDIYLNETIFLSQLPSDDGIATEITRFTIIDLNYDGIPEMVLCLSLADGIDINYRILSFKENQVYSYSIADRAFSELKTDGTFHFSSSAANSGFGKILLQDNTCLIDKIAYSEDCGFVNSKSEWKLTYFINDQNVSQDEFTKAINYQQTKPAAIWYTFSNDNIVKYFSQQSH